MLSGNQLLSVQYMCTGLNINNLEARERKEVGGGGKSVCSSMLYSLRPYAVQNGLKKSCSVS